MPVSNIIRHKKKKRSLKKVLPVTEDIEGQEEESDEEELDGFGGIMEYFEAFIFESINIRAFLIAAIYFVLSFALPFLNKTLLVTFNFHGIIFLLLIQCLVTISMLDIISNFLTIFTRKVSLTDCLACWKLSLYSCGNVYFSLHSIRGLNIAVIGKKFFLQ
jgi:hypothetical protein